MVVVRARDGRERAGRERGVWVERERVRGLRVVLECKCEWRERRTHLNAELVLFDRGLAVLQRGVEVEAPVLRQNQQDVRRDSESGRTWVRLMGVTLLGSSRRAR